MMIEEPIDPPAKVLQFTGEHKAPPDGTLMLVPPPFGKCIHFNTSFEIDEDAGKAVCLGCKEEVSLLFVLKQLMRHESRWNQTRMAHQQEMKRLEERASTKCRHCGKLTRISHR